jgi:hypothetical protein
MFIWSCVSALGVFQVQGRFLIVVLLCFETVFFLPGLKRKTGRVGGLLGGVVGRE